MNAITKFNEDTMMECDDLFDNTLDIVSGCVGLQNTRRHKRKKLRRLVDSKGCENKKHVSGSKCKGILKATALIILSIVLLMSYISHNNSNTNELLRTFLQNYRNQYTEIVNGQSNYCDAKQPLDTATLLAGVRENHILHQENALWEVEVALRNESYLNAIALVGPVGVGKTLLIRTLQQNFPWPENVHTYIWNTYVSDEAEKFHIVRILVDKLSECGQNLLVIENLQACDYGAVPLINQLLVEANKKRRKRVVIFYVFNLNTMLTPEAYAVHKDLLKSLPDCTVINFKPFTQHELIDCVKREAERENLELDDEDYDEIVQTIDPSKSGCKNVNAKVLMYGKIKTVKN